MREGHERSGTTVKPATGKRRFRPLSEQLTAQMREYLWLHPEVAMRGHSESASALAQRLLLDVGPTASGRVLLSTLHRRDATGAVSSLRNFGLEDQEIVATREVVVAPRLVRRLCPQCRKLEAPSNAEQKRLMSLGQVVPPRTWRASGYGACRGSGHRRRIGVFEVWRLDEAAGEWIAAHTDEQTLRRTMRERGLKSSCTTPWKKRRTAPAAWRRFRPSEARGDFTPPHQPRSRRLRQPIAIARMTATRRIAGLP